MNKIWFLKIEKKLSLKSDEVSKQAWFKVIHDVKF